MGSISDFFINVSKIIFLNSSIGNISPHDVIEFRIEVEGRKEYLISKGFDTTKDYVRVVKKKIGLQYVLYFNDSNLCQYFKLQGLNVRYPVIYNVGIFDNCFSKNDYIKGLLNSGLHFGNNRINYNFINKYNNTYFRITYI